MTSRKDVARLAKVSPASVSYYINSSGYVSKEARERIQKAIDELGYVPNQIASSLRRQSNKQFVFLCNEIRNPFYSQLIYSATRDAAGLGYCILFSPVIGDDAYLKRILGYQVSGLFASNNRLDRSLVESLAKRNVPVVLLKDIEWEDFPENISFIKMDFSQIFVSIKNHLESNGYHNPCYLSASLSADTFKMDSKTMWFKTVFGDDSTIMYGIANTEDAYNLVMGKYSHGTLPDSFICTNDAVAYGVKKALNDLHAAVPEDCAIIGFDNTYNSRYASPAITSVGYEVEDIGKLIIKMLIDKEQGITVQNKIIKSKLFIRESSSRAQ